MDDDIDDFIRKQKAILAKERNVLGGSQDLSSNDQVDDRRKWDKQGYIPSFEPKAERHVPNTATQDSGLKIERGTHSNNQEKSFFDKFGKYDDIRKRIQRERRLECSAFLGRNTGYERKPPPTPEHQGLPVGGYEEKRKKLQEERSKEYNALIAKQGTPTHGSPFPQHNGTDPSGHFDEKRNRQNSERRQGQNSYLDQGQDQRSSQGYVFGQGEIDISAKRKKAMLDQRKEYNEWKKNPDMQRNGFKENVPPAAADDGGLFSKLGSHDDKRKQLMEERKREYNEKMSGEKVRATGVVDHQTQNYVSNLPGFKESDNGDDDDLPPPDNRIRPRPSYQITSLPGVRDHPSAQVAKIKDRNREYNDYLRDRDEGPYNRGGRRRAPQDSFSDEEDDYRQYLRNRPPRKGWGTPTYEEILDRKRQEERSYRRHEDVDSYGSPRDAYYDRDRDRDRDRYRDRDIDSEREMRLGDRNYMRTSISDGHINRRFEEEERRYRDLDRDYERKKVTILNQDTDPVKSSYRRDRGRDRDFDRMPKYNPSEELSRRPERPPERGRFSDRPPIAPEPAKGGTVGAGGGIGAGGGGGRGTDGQYNATLMIGGDVRASADQKKKAAYRQELQRQMQLEKSNRRKEKDDGFVPAPSSISGPGDLGRAPPQRLPPDPRPPVRYPQTRFQEPSKPDTYQPSLLDDNFSPRKILWGNDSNSVPQNEILANGFGSQMFRPNPMLPSSNFKGSLLGNLQGNPPSGLMHDQVDDPYNFYAKNNPLDALNTGGYDPIGMPDIRSNQPLSSRLENQPRQPPPQDDYPFPSGEDRKPDPKSKRSYQQELLEQIEQQKKKKEAAKRAQDLYDQKKDEEIRNYDPFGRGGAGAPVRDKFGNIVTDLKAMRASNDRALLEPQIHTDTDPASFSSDPPAVGSNGPLSDTEHARGGHGIFGEPMTDAQKRVQTSYQDELRKQMEEKKRQQDLEKEREKAEEAKMMRKIEEDQRRMKEELEKEKRKEREKQEEAQRQQEELRRQQELRKKEEDERRKKEEEKRQEEVRKRQEEERVERERKRQEHRSSSPPVPALKVKMKQEDYRTDSPPVPALAKNRPPPETLTNDKPRSPENKQSRPSSNISRQGSADILQQLARMKKQLENEKQRVETDLKSEEPKPYDSRRAAPSGGNRQIDIMEVVQNKQPVSVRRNAPSSGQLKDFNDLRNRSDSATRQNLRSMFPEAPITKDALEAQQKALIREQQDELRELGGPRPFERNMPSMRPRDLGLRAPSNLSDRLDSDTAFVTMPNSGDLPDDLEDLQRQVPTRNESARDRRRNRTPTINDVYPQKRREPDPMGSVISLDPDTLSRRNEERLRRLKNMGADDVSLGDPDDILERFMAKQVHDSSSQLSIVSSRPPTASTVADDTWMSAGPSNMNFH